MLGLGLGTFLLSTLFLTQTNLLSHIKSVGSDQNPNVVLFDIQTDQRQELRRALVAGMDLPLLQQVPIVTMHVHSVKGQPARTILRDTTSNRRRRGNWALRHEYRATYRDSLTETEEVVAGTWRSQPANDTLYVSLETGVASSLGVGVGDSLTFDVQGVPIEVVVGSLRQVNWQRIMPNFLAVFPPGILEPAPQSHVLVTRAATTEQMAALQRATVRQFPNVSVIDLGSILSTVDTILDKVSLVVRFMALFSVSVGLIVLVGVIASSRYQRIEESVLLKTLGASRRQVVAIMALEYLFLGAFAAATGVILSLGGVWALNRHLFRDRLRARLPARDPRLCGGQSANSRRRHDLQPQRPHQPTPRSPALARLANLIPYRRSSAYICGYSAQLAAQLLQHRPQRRPHGFGDDLVAFDVGMVAIGQVQRGLVAHAF